MSGKVAGPRAKTSAKMRKKKGGNQASSTRGKWPALPAMTWSPTWQLWIKEIPQELCESWLGFQNFEASWVICQFVMFLSVFKKHSKKCAWQRWTRQPLAPAQHLQWRSNSIQACQYAAPLPKSSKICKPQASPSDQVKFGLWKKNLPQPLTPTSFFAWQIQHWKALWLLSLPELRVFSMLWRKWLWARKKHSANASTTPGTWGSSCSSSVEHQPCDKSSQRSKLKWGYWAEASEDVCQTKPVWSWNPIDSTVAATCCSFTSFTSGSSASACVIAITSCRSGLLRANICKISLNFGGKQGHKAHLDGFTNNHRLRQVYTSSVLLDLCQSETLMFGQRNSLGEKIILKSQGSVNLSLYQWKNKHGHCQMKLKGCVLLILQFLMLQKRHTAAEKIQEELSEDVITQPT